MLSEKVEMFLPMARSLSTDSVTREHATRSSVFSIITVLFLIVFLLYI